MCKGRCYEENNEEKLPVSLRFSFYRKKLGITNNIFDRVQSLSGDERHFYMIRELLDNIDPTAEIHFFKN